MGAIFADWGVIRTLVIPYRLLICLERGVVSTARMPKIVERRQVRPL
jgi:hypothetical protein